MKPDLNGKKLEMKYPCPWTYKLIGSDVESIREAVVKVVQEKKYEIDFSNRSKTGKYSSVNLRLVVQTEEERNLLFTALKSHPAIVMVL